MFYQDEGQVPHIGGAVIADPSSNQSGSVGIRETHHPLRSDVKLGVIQNMLIMSVTLETSQEARSALKLVAP